MFREFLSFELRFWAKGFMVWIFLVVLTLLLMSVLVADEPILEDVFFGNALRNSPFVIHRLYGITAVFGCLMVTAFVNAAAIREYAYRTDQLIFTKPISKYGYLLGRFIGASVISLIPMLGASLAVFISEAIMSGPNWGPTNLSAHLWSILTLAIPNTFFISAVVFAIAVWTRSTLASFLGILGLMVALSISDALLTTLASEYWAALLEPFGEGALRYMTKYWTVSDKNTLFLGFEGVFLWNRILWMGIGCVFLTAACIKFSFTLKPGLIGRAMNFFRDRIEESIAVPFHTNQLPKVTRSFNSRARITQLVRIVRMELWATLKSPVYICIMIGVVLLSLSSVSLQASEGFGLSALPVTFSMVAILRDALIQFQIVLITFYAGVFVWKERDAKLDEVFDALPIPTWLPYLGKLIALGCVILSVIFAGIFCGLTFQLIKQFFSFQLDVYLTELLFIDMVQFSCLIVMAILCQVISPNKYVGYFVFIAFVVANTILWPILGIQSRMVQYGNLPGYTYSDFFGRQPYALSLWWFAIYWGLCAITLSIVTALLWPRGRERGAGSRIGLAMPRWRGKLRWATVGIIASWVICGVWVFWNTEIRNTYQSTEQQQAEQASYEKEYKSVSEIPQPRVMDVKYEIDIFPERRGLLMKGEQTISNRDSEPIDTIYVLTMKPFETEVHIEGATLAENDDVMKMLKFQLDTAMQPGDSRKMNFTVKYEPIGFENSVEVNQIVQNGTFFNNLIGPQIGYMRQAELTDIEERENHGLVGTGVTPLEPDNLEARRNHYISSNSDWVNVETVISTSEDQIAIAPGSLKDSWKKDGRRYFHYELDHPSLNFFSFCSAKYKVDGRKWNGVDVEVYYHPEHEWNVDLMLNSIRKSLEYYSEAFGPYKHKQARIVEFPRVQFFAQAFPGTMPYSEGVGFIADIQGKDDIDMVFYVVAHEIAHQWWAHQVIGANMRGATMLSETLAQYSALMVMEKEFGRDMMRKFLKYEMDNYLRFRGRAKAQENPLREVESNQGYIHYNKGSVAMYHLKETIGEDRLNAALRSVVDRFGYADGPYPTSMDLIEAIRKETPPEHYGLLVDLFDNITLFQNRTVTAEYKKIADDKFEVTIDVEFKKFHAGEDGKEKEVKVDDWIEIGAFAKPGFLRKYGETLYRERVHITEPRKKFTFTVDKAPHRAGVDPISLLIDRNTADNMKKPELAGDKGIEKMAKAETR